LNKLKNDMIRVLYTVMIGVISGLIIWTFLKVMNLGIEFIWEYMPSVINFKYYAIVVCTIGGFLIGLWKQKYGDGPEELDKVMNKVKENHRYSYDNIFSTIVSSLLPLIIGASIGPEAGLTGIIAGLCTWAGDKLKTFNREMEELTSIGITATLGTIFASPIFGFVEPLENEEDMKLPKTSKNILYFVAILSSFGILILLNNLTNTHVGLHSMGTTTLTNLNITYVILLILLGIFLAYFYFLSNKLVKLAFQNFKENPITKAVIGGLFLGILGTLLPLTMFSGEEQIYVLLENGAQLGFLVLLLTAILKIVLTNICIETGLKGGHFFPMIFSGTALGYAMSIIINIDPIVSMSILTTSFMANILKKPLAVVLLMMIIFPVNLIPLMLVAAVISCLFRTPRELLLSSDTK